MTVHFLGAEIEPGKIGRIAGRLSDADFQRFVTEHGGELPPDMLAWHIEDDADILTDPAYQALAAIPLIGVTKDGDLTLINPAKASRRRMRVRMATINDLC